MSLSPVLTENGPYIYRICKIILWHKPLKFTVEPMVPGSGPGFHFAKSPEFSKLVTLQSKKKIKMLVK